MRWPRAYYEALSGPGLSRIAEIVADARLPRPALDGLIRAFCAAYDVNLEEAQVPPQGFETFNAFFTRALRPGARPIAADTGVIVSPADARLASAGPIPADLRLEAIKGRSYGLATLLADDSLAERLVGGFYATLYLSPRDYHRVHSPCDGAVTAVRQVPGRRYPVMPSALEAIDGLLAKNARTIVELDSDVFGRVVVVLVGATNVSRISLAFDQNRPTTLMRGEELGAFNLGSTVVLLVERHDLELAPAGDPNSNGHPPLGRMTAVGRALFRDQRAE